MLPSAHTFGSARYGVLSSELSICRYTVWSYLHQEAQAPSRRQRNYTQRIHPPDTLHLQNMPHSRAFQVPVRPPADVSSRHSPHETRDPDSRAPYNHRTEKASDSQESDVLFENAPHSRKTASDLCAIFHSSN